MNRLLRQLGKEQHCPLRYCFRKCCNICMQVIVASNAVYFWLDQWRVQRVCLGGGGATPKLKLNEI